MKSYVRKNIIDWNKRRFKAAEERLGRVKDPERREEIASDMVRYQSNIDQLAVA